MKGPRKRLSYLYNKINIINLQIKYIYTGPSSHLVNDLARFPRHQFWLVDLNYSVVINAPFGRACSARAVKTFRLWWLKIRSSVARAGMSSGDLIIIKKAEKMYSLRRSRTGCKSFGMPWKTKTLSLWKLYLTRPIRRKLSHILVQRSCNDACKTVFKGMQSCVTVCVFFIQSQSTVVSQYVPRCTVLMWFGVDWC